MTTIEQQLDALRREGLSFSRTPEQRAAAKTAFNAIANAAIQGAIANLKQGTELYKQLNEQLAALIEKIQNDAAPDILGGAAKFVSTLKNGVIPPTDN